MYRRELLLRVKIGVCSPGLCGQFYGTEYLSYFIFFFFSVRLKLELALLSCEVNFIGLRIYFVLFFFSVSVCSLGTTTARLLDLLFAHRPDHLPTCLPVCLPARPSSYLP